MHVRCMGSGKPTVILLAGLGNDAESWRGIQPRIAGMTRVCSYDRPGYGTSDGSNHPLHAEYTTSELEKLLSAAGVGPPYVVVGHSYGGFEAVMFAHRNMGSTGAVVLVDASFPHHDSVFAEASPSFGRFYRKMMADRIEVSRSCISSIEAGSDDCVGPPNKQRFLSFMKSRLSVYENWKLSSDQVAAINTLGNLPLFVLTAGANKPMQEYDGKENEDGPAIRAAWLSMHERYARLSTAGVHIVVPGANHEIQNERPDVLMATIAQAIWRSGNFPSGARPQP